MLAYMGESDDWLGIMVADADGENPRLLVPARQRSGPASQGVTAAAVGSPQWSHDSRRVVYRRGVWEPDGLVTTIESRGLDEDSSVVLVRDDKPTGAIKDDNRVWSLDFLVLEDRLVYARNEPPPRSREQNLWQVALDPSSGRPRGEPRRLTEWVGFRLGGFSATADGSQVAIGSDRSQGDVFVGELTEDGWSLGDQRRLTLDDRNDEPSCWTPDGRAVVFESDRSGNPDLLVQGLDERGARDLVPGAGDQSGAHLTPDGKSYLYWTQAEDASRLVGLRRLVRIPIGGGPIEPVLETRGLAWVDCATRPDGPCLLVEVRLAEGIGVVSRLDPVAGKGDELWHWEIDPTTNPRAALSPDGTRLALVAHAPFARSIRLIDAASGRILREFEPQGVQGLEPRDVEWSPDGQGLFVTGETARGVSLLRVGLQGKTRVLREDRTGDFASVKPSPDGRHLAFGKVTWDWNVWMIEKF